MKFFSWMQNKLNGIQDNKKQDTFSALQVSKQESREEFSDWPHGLLAIGTFGNNEIKDDSEALREDIQVEEDPSSSEEEIVDFSPEEVGKLQKELTKLLSRKPNAAEKQVADLPLDRFLNCPSSLEVDRRISNSLYCDSDDTDEDIERTISLIIGKCKDICADNKKKAIGKKKSISFLLKKMFVCRSGFTPTPPPSLRETLHESRMEKLLRTILQKKISPQNSSQSSLKRYIDDNKRSAKRRNEEEEQQQQQGIVKDGSKWVKTDSEYIVLEI